LWAYVAAGALVVFGHSLVVYVTVMLTGTTAALLAVFATFRRVTGSSLVAIGLFLPFVATSFFMAVGPLENRYGPANLFSVFPIRYAGPYILLWLIVRRLTSRPARGPMPLFVVAGLVAINNPEFGVAAFGASLVALFVAEPERSPASIARLLGSALAGLVGAAAIVAALTFAVAGTWPHFEMLSTFPRIYGTEGFNMRPMPSFGLHLALYATFVAAFVVAAVRALVGEHDAGLTGALAWAGIFGLGASVYFVGHSHPHVLIDIFSAWVLALSFLVVVVVRAIRERASHRPTAIELLVIVGFSISICSLAQTPTPWSQLQRIREATPSGQGFATIPSAMRIAVTALTPRGQRVAMLMQEGHRIAEDLGLVNTLPYMNHEVLVTPGMWREAVEASRRAGGTTLLVPTLNLNEEHLRWLQRAGYESRNEVPEVGLIEFVPRHSR
jgi:hypothetical protein